MFACVRGMLSGSYAICKAVKKWVQKNGDLFDCSCMISSIQDPLDDSRPKYFVCFGPAHCEEHDVSPTGSNNNSDQNGSPESGPADQQMSEAGGGAAQQNGAPNTNGV